jgi:hypothetical protein
MTGHGTWDMGDTLTHPHPSGRAARLPAVLFSGSTVRFRWLYGQWSVSAARVSADGAVDDSSPARGMIGVEKNSKRANRWR